MVDCKVFWLYFTKKMAKLHDEMKGNVGTAYANFKAHCFQQKHNLFTISIFNHNFVYIYYL